MQPSSPSLPPHTCPHTLLHTHPHTHTHAYTHTHNTHAHTHTHTHSHARTHTHTHTHLHTHTHTHTHTHIQVCTYVPSVGVDSKTVDVVVVGEGRGSDEAGTAMGELSGVGATEVVSWGTTLGDVAAMMGELLAAEETTTSEGAICMTTEVVSIVTGEVVTPKVGGLTGVTEMTGKVETNSDELATLTGELAGATARGEEERASDELIRATRMLVGMMPSGEVDRTSDSATNVLLGAAAAIGDVVIAAVTAAVELKGSLDMA